MKIAKVSTDFLYSIGAQVVINLVMHLIVFPWLNKVAGPEFTGRVLACLSVVYIFASSMGVSMVYSRQVEEKKGSGINGDYLWMLLPLSVLMALVGLATKWCGCDPLVNVWWFIALIILTLIRGYIEVDFRLKVNFRAYFLYYCLVSAGYLAGLLLYRQTGNWTHIFLPGEIAACVMILCRRTIFVPGPASARFFPIFKSILLLFASSAMLQIVVSGDRLIMQFMVGDRAVTVFSSMSLPSKIANMAIIPLGSLLITYLTSAIIPITKKWMLKVSAVWIPVCLAGLACTTIATPIYVKLFYPNLYQDIQGIYFLVNLGLFLSMFGFLFRVYLIVTSPASTVFNFEGLCTVIHLVLVIALTKYYGMKGYAYGVIIGRALRIVLGAILTWKFVGKAENQQPATAPAQ